MRARVCVCVCVCARARLRLRALVSLAMCVTGTEQVDKGGCKANSGAVLLPLLSCSPFHSSHAHTRARARTSTHKCECRASATSVPSEQRRSLLRKLGAGPSFRDRRGSCCQSGLNGTGAPGPRAAAWRSPSGGGAIRSREGVCLLPKVLSRKALFERRIPRPKAESFL